MTVHIPCGGEVRAQARSSIQPVFGVLTGKRKRGVVPLNSTPLTQLRGPAVCLAVVFFISRLEVDINMIVEKKNVFEHRLERLVTGSHGLVDKALVRDTLA
jgi:hypothetical protein